MYYSNGLVNETQISVLTQATLNGFEERVFQDHRIDLIERSISFMQANINKRMSIEEFADEFCYSPSRYSTIFKQKTGLAPMDYFIRIKMELACYFLMHSDLFVKEIAGKIGYDDPYYFSRIFKKVTGKAPMEYKYDQGGSLAKSA